MEFVIMEFIELLAAAIGFFAIHIGLAGTSLRDRVALRFGDSGFQMIFSLLSFFLLVWMVASYRNAPSIVVWDFPQLYWLPIIISPFSAIFLIAAFSSPNATAAGGGKALKRHNPDRGIFRVTRHPFLIAAAMWASAHMLANGDVASLILFGSILATSAFGPASIDAKLRRRSAEDFERLAATTSIIPFGAIAQGRTVFRFAEIGLLRITGGLALYAGLYYSHEYVSGVRLP
jgi:uncharacterized membrane protein